MNVDTRLSKNLYKMLVYILEYSNTNLDETDVDKQWDALDLFCVLLNEAIGELYDHNYFEQYREYNEPVSNVRGRFNIVKSINTGCYFQGKMFCNYNQLDIDNATNQLIKLAINRINNIISFTKRKQYQEKYQRYYSKVLDELYNVSDIDYEIDEEFKIDCLNSQPDYCWLAIELSYFIVRYLPPIIGNKSMSITTDDLASKIIESFCREFLAKEFKKATSLLGDELRIIIPAAHGYRERKLPMDIALKDSKASKALIIDVKDHKNLEDAPGIHQVIDYYHEAKATWDTYNQKYTVNLALIASGNKEDYNKPFHDEEGKIRVVAVYFIDFDNWDFEDICRKLLNIANNHF